MMVCYCGILNCTFSNHKMEATPTAAAAAAVVLRNENVEASHSAEEKIT